MHAYGSGAQAVQCSGERKRRETIGLTESDSQLKRWMVAGQELARITTEYRGKLESSDKIFDSRHEEIPWSQKTFQRHVIGLINAINDLGDPFKEAGGELYTILTPRLVTGRHPINMQC